MRGLVTNTLSKLLAAKGCKLILKFGWALLRHRAKLGWSMVKKFVACLNVFSTVQLGNWPYCVSHRLSSFS